MTLLRLFALVALLTFSGATGSLAANSPSNYITVLIPEKVIEEAFAKTLPLTFESESEKLEGTITIIKISNLSLSNKTVLCHLELQGHNLHLVSTVANQTVRLKLGDARIDFDCQARLRYDAGQKTLFVSPVAQDIEANQTLEDGDIGQALLMLLSGREYPVELEEIQPIIAEASNKTITIMPQVADINTVAGALQIKLQAVVDAVEK